MRIHHTFISIAVLACLYMPAAAHAGLLNWFYGQSWDFMESVGGVAIGDANRTPKGTVFLPIKCDVSGLTNVTKKPNLMNSALVVDKISMKVHEREILISVDTGLAKSKSKCTCEGVDLGDVPAGRYDVFYYGSDREKHLVGTAIVPQK